MPEMTMAKALNDAMRGEMERDEDVVVLGEDVGRDGGVFRVTEGLIDEFGEERVIDTPLSESGIVGTSVGMAVYGMRPVAEIQFMGFSYPAFNQILSHVSRIRRRSQSRYTVPMVIRMPYGGGVEALEHHSESTEALYCHIPGLKVVAPSTPGDAKGLLTSAMRDPDPVFFMEPKRLYRSGEEEVPDGEHTVPLSEARVAREGEDVTLVAWGAMVPQALEAAKQADERGIDVEVLDLRTLSPMGTGAVVKSVKKTGRAVVAHEAPRTLGLGAEVAARINEEALLHLKAPVRRVTGYDVVVPLPKYEEYHYPGPEKLLWGVEEVVNF